MRAMRRLWAGWAVRALHALPAAEGAAGRLAGDGHHRGAAAEEGVPTADLRVAIFVTPFVLCGLAPMGAGDMDVFAR